NNPAAYATAGERMLMAIGEPEHVDTRNDPRLSRIFANNGKRCCVSGNRLSLAVLHIRSAEARAACLSHCSSA
ncbi:hypothetical protein KQH58_16040, partial [Mycetohabitans sp. B6]|nr:hypothetical protein [Mycetohabitans sp. B6]